MTSLSQNLGLTASALSFFLSGTISSITFNQISSIVSLPLPPRTVLHLWKAMFDLGKIQMPTIALVASALHVSSACSHPSTNSWWKIDGRSVMAAVLTIAIAPFTFAVMGGTNAVLIAGAEGVGKLEEESVKALVVKWGKLNLIRSVLPLLGGIMGIIVSITRDWGYPV